MILSRQFESMLGLQGVGASYWCCWSEAGQAAPCASSIPEPRVSVTPTRRLGRALGGINNQREGFCCSGQNRPPHALSPTPVGGVKLMLTLGPLIVLDSCAYGTGRSDGPLIPQFPAPFHRKEKENEK